MRVGDTRTLDCPDEQCLGTLYGVYGGAFVSERRFYIQQFINCSACCNCGKQPREMFRTFDTTEQNVKDLPSFNRKGKRITQIGFPVVEAIAGKVCSPEAPQILQAKTSGLSNLDSDRPESEQAYQREP